MDSELVDELVKNDIILHLAAVVGVKHVMNNPVDTIRVNILGTKIYYTVAQHTVKSTDCFNFRSLWKSNAIWKSDQGLNEDNDTVMGRLV